LHLEPKAHPHQKDAMTDMTHGNMAQDQPGRAKTLHFLLGHRDAAEHVMFLETLFDLFHLGEREVTALNDLCTGFGIRHVTFRTKYNFLVNKRGALFLQARPMNPFLATIH